MEQLEKRYPGRVQAEVKCPELDLISAAGKPDPERRNLVAEAKSQGYGVDCLLALSQKLKSIKLAAEYLAKLDAE